MRIASPTRMAPRQSPQTALLFAAVLCLSAWIGVDQKSRAQGLSILSTTPADSSTNVPLNTEIAFRLDHAIDTTALSEDGLPIGAFIGPRDSLTIRRHRTADERTKVLVDVTHTAATDYAWIVTGADGADTTSLDVTYVLRYTTASEWGAYAVRGYVARIALVKRGNPDPRDVVVTLLDQPPTVDSSWTFTGFDRIVAATVMGDDGKYVIDRVRSGTYWPVAFIDNDGDGRINGEDRVGTYAESGRDSIVVQADDVNGIGIELVVGGNSEGPVLSHVAELGEIHPNPTRGAAQIELELARPATVSLGIFNLLGQEVRQVVEADFLPSGAHRIGWDASSLAAGAYLCRLQVNGETRSRLFFVTK